MLRKLMRRRRGVSSLEYVVLAAALALTATFGIIASGQANRDNLFYIACVMARAVNLGEGDCARTPDPDSEITWLTPAGRILTLPLLTP
jgi:hypothetical protein